jgi:mono/diheme cytochrome c family protein
MILQRAPLIIAGLVAAGATVGCGGDASRVADDFDPGPTPFEFIAGETMYTGSCATCHGTNGTGTTTGPPLVHKIYEPSHHADAAFHRSVQLGVVAHHWQFGPMAPVEGLPPEQVDRIIAYVRWLQRQAGIS